MDNCAFLETTNVFLRPLEYEDLGGEYLKGINQQDLDVYTEHAQLPKNTQTLRAYAESKWQSGDIWLGIFLKEDGRHIGNIELSEIDYIHRKAKYAILLWAEAGRGYATEASTALISFAFNKLNMNRLELGVNENNSAAIRLYAKLGFVKEGVLREAFIRNGVKGNLIAMGLLKKEFISKVDSADLVESELV